MKNLIVKAYSGYKLNEKPTSFTLDGAEHFIDEIIDSWVGEEYNFWKVKTETGKKSLLKYSPTNDAWEVF